MAVKLSPQATRSHLIVGAVLILLALGCMIASMFLASKILVVLIFFFGVWGGVESGRRATPSPTSRSHCGCCERPVCLPIAKTSFTSIITWSTRR